MALWPYRNECQPGRVAGEAILAHWSSPLEGKMKILPTLSALLFGTLVASAQSADTKSDLKLLYVADGTSQARATAFESFLNERFGEVAAADHQSFQPAAARAADVVILDWSMAKGDMPPSDSPLGERADWSRPTVLLGTAGLHHSCAWEVAGGSG